MTRVSGNFAGSNAIVMAGHEAPLHDHLKRLMTLNVIANQIENAPLPFLITAKTTPESTCSITDYQAAIPNRRRYWSDGEAYTTLYDFRPDEQQNARPGFARDGLFILSYWLESLRVRRFEGYHNLLTLKPSNQ